MASFPTVEKVSATNANTPNGAANIMIDTIFIHISFALSNIFLTGSAFSPIMLIATPVSNAKNIICNISPFAKAAIDPKNTIISVKRLIGRSLDDVQSRYTNLPYEFVASENGLPLLVTHQGNKSPIEVSADILSRLNHIAEQRLAGELSGVVITVCLLYTSDAADD